METANHTLSVLSRDTTSGPMASIPQIVDPNPSLPAASVVLPIFAGLALLLQIPALVWHIRTRNLGASSQIIWISFVLLFFVINPIIWPRDDYWNWWPGYGLCDVESRILLGAYVGLPGSAMCIVRKLLVVLDPDSNPVPTKAQRRRELVLDLFLCIGFPILIMIVFYVVQANRYTIFTTTGCVWWIERTWASIALVLMWPLVLSIINAYLSVVLMWRLYKHRQELQGILREKGTRKSHFYRLIAIALILTIGILLLAIQGVYLPLRGGLLPFSWKLIHSNWDPALLPSNGTFPFWYGPLAIILGFFIFFCYGLGRDTIEMYKSWFRVFGLEKYFPSLLPGSANSTENSSKFTWASFKKTILRTTSSTPSYKDKDSMSQTISNTTGSRLDSVAKAPVTPGEGKAHGVVPMDPMDDFEFGPYSFKVNDDINDEKDFYQRHH